jgi:hypothetical protein
VAGDEIRESLFDWAAHFGGLEGLCVVRRSAGGRRPCVKEEGVLMRGWE